MIPLGTLAGSRYAPAGPVVLTSDSFNRTNRQLTGSTDAALGGAPLPWHTNSTSIANFAVISGQLGANSSTDKYAYAAVNVGVSSMVVSFKVGAYSGAAGFALHASSLDKQPEWGESYELYISEYGLDLSAGVEYDGIPNTLTEGDLVELVSDYPSVSVRINGVTVMSVTDTSGSAPGTYAGISRVGSTSTSWRIDDFMVSEVTASVPSNPAPSPPGWFAELTTGTPEATSVTVTATALAVDDVMVTGYEYSVNSGTTWAAITPSGNDFNITGLTPSTSYPAPLLRAKDADGNVSAVLMAQAFSTSAAAGGGAEWFGAVETPPEGASALVVFAHPQQAPHASAVTVGGTPATLIAQGGNDGTSGVFRSISAWWCPDPGASGEVEATPASSSRTTMTLYVRNVIPEEAEASSNNAYSAITDQFDALVKPGGFVFSCMTNRSAEPVFTHSYFDTGHPATNVKWTVSETGPTAWHSLRYHAIFSCALNPIGT